ncbi:hypothetical protein EVAR_18908_1 [Eumeta japonica]|uniref:Uncharacterized protein n=1 Tax=Eumeta variegata TaxID=151549 RepID=A0A4C1V3F3_EUMVA|nr:hypothetical protein EVAR_18908_1 [Eumeta japonica]
MQVTSASVMRRVGVPLLASDYEYVLDNRRGPCRVRPPTVYFSGVHVRMRSVDSSTSFSHVASPDWTQKVLVFYIDRSCYQINTASADIAGLGSGS